MGGLGMAGTMIKDGLWDAFNGYHMGSTAENVARQWQITREQQDQFAAESQRKAAEAQAWGRLEEEIARCVVFLASEDAGFVAGSTISANGGQHMARAMIRSKAKPP